MVQDLRSSSQPDEETHLQAVQLSNRIGVTCVVNQSLPGAISRACYWTLV